MSVRNPRRMDLGSRRSRWVLPAVLARPLQTFGRTRARCSAAVRAATPVRIAAPRHPLTITTPRATSRRGIRRAKRSQRMRAWVRLSFRITPPRPVTSPPRGRRTGRHFRLAPVHLHSLEAARCGGARLLFRTARLVGRGMQEPGTTAEWSLRASPRSARRSSPMKVDRDCEPWSISQPLTPAGDRTLKD
jgi:hypothetical protein